MTKLPRLLVTLLPLTLAVACGGDDTPADSEGTETSGDGDGDATTGDGDGDATTGDGDGDATTGDGDGDPVTAQLRVLHLGVDAPPVDVYVDGDMNPAVANLAFQQGTAYLDLAPGPHSVSVTPAGDPNTIVLALDNLDLTVGTKYSAVAYDYLANISALLLTDDDAVDPANIRAQVSHTAPDVGEVDVWVLSDPPALLLENFAYGTTASADYPAGPLPLGIDVDDDMVPDLRFDVPALPGGTFVDLYAVNENGGAPVFLLGHLPDGSTVRIDTTECGNGIQQGPELCDGDDFGAQTCADFGFDGGSLGCSDACDAIDTAGCYMEFSQCFDTPTMLNDGGNLNANAVNAPIVVATPDDGTIVDVWVTVDITHLNLTDLDVRLTRNGANGSATDLFQDIEAIGGGLCTGDDMVATISDMAVESIQTEACNLDNTPAVSGTYAPDEALNNYDGDTMNATWNLRVYDDTTNMESGTLNQWCINIGYQPLVP